MIKYQIMYVDQVHKLREINRSEYIDLIYKMHNGKLKVLNADHECPNWDEKIISEIQKRYLYELHHGGMAVGAFDGEILVGFGVLAHKLRGINKDRNQIDLMYVSKNYRRKGIGTKIMDELCQEARSRGAKYIYISSTETRSAVSFYKSNGSKITDDIDEELFNKEPNDIHMIKEL